MLFHQKTLIKSLFLLYNETLNQLTRSTSHKEHVALVFACIGGGVEATLF